jgi:putative ATP-dependent endonuclease of OLD family
MIKGLVGKLLDRLGGKSKHQSRRSPAVAKLIVVVEGRHDIEFLRRISRMLHLVDHTLPDLGERERAGELIFLPIGGGDIASWGTALAGFGLQELHIYDRELPPETELRQRAAELVNKRPGCRAFVTGMRSLENYIHPLCIREVSGLDLTFNGDDDVADLAARACYERDGGEPPWEMLTGRAKKRCRERAKRWLNRAAVERMMPWLLDERDEAGEIRRWLATIAQMLRQEDCGEHAG